MSETITTWRDLIGELTEQQIAQLSAAAWPEPELLAAAQDYATTNRIQAAHSHISGPADATRLGNWWDNGSEVTRFFDGTTRPVGATTVLVAGEQFPDSRCRRWIEIHDCGEMTPVVARELAAALQAAADETDRLNDDEPPFI